MSRYVAILALWTVAGLCAAQGGKPTPITMQLNWHAQADFGGYFTAKADGLYEQAGLDVTLKQGGPQLNTHQLLAAGQVDFIMGTSVRTLAARNQGVPIVAVAAYYQKDPVTFMVHDESGYRSIEDLKGKPIFLPGIARINYWPWLKAKYGFTDEQIRPYDGSFRAVSLDKTAASQGYLTNDAFVFSRLGMKGRSILLADHGWVPYSSTLDTTDKMVAEKPAIVRAFARATSEGYVRYLDNPARAHALIKQMNPQMDDELMRQTYEIMRSAQLVTPTGVKPGSMTDTRWEQTYKLLSESGVLPAGFDYRKAYTLEFAKDL
jgi:NitT/TauT family transport system substrate-binding protein